MAGRFISLSRYFTNGQQIDLLHKWPTDRFIALLANDGRVVHQMQVGQVSAGHENGRLEYLGDVDGSEGVE